MHIRMNLNEAAVNLEQIWALGNQEEHVEVMMWREVYFPEYSPALPLPPKTLHFIVCLGRERKGGEQRGGK